MSEEPLNRLGLVNINQRKKKQLNEAEIIKSFSKKGPGRK
jgi:hypothetical protein